MGHTPSHLGQRLFVSEFALIKTLTMRTGRELTLVIRATLKEIFHLNWFQLKVSAWNWFSAMSNCIKHSHAKTRFLNIES